MPIEAASDRMLREVEELLFLLSLPTAGLRDQFPAAYVVAKEFDVVGCAGLETYGEVGLLRSVAVSPTFQNRGMGARLVEDRLTAAKMKRLEAVYLLTTSAAGFFARLGFVPADRTKVPAALAASLEFSTVCPAAATCLRFAP
jgi:N-acetylglutamate synthase-like GNAT family acetyltransferase